MPATRNRCQAQDPASCVDPRCPQRMALAQAFEEAVKAGDINALLSIPHPSTPHVVPKKKSRSRAAQQPIGRLVDGRDQQYRDLVLADMRKSANLVIDPVTGKKTVSVFRAGSMKVPTQRWREGEAFLYADQRRPAGRRGRNDSLYASPTLDTGRRWVRANVTLRMPNSNLYELRVDPDTTHVYSITNWEWAEREHYYVHAVLNEWQQERIRKSMDTYWEQSMTLTQWYAYVAEHPEVEPRDWEILLSPEDVQKSSKVAWERVCDEAFREWELDDLARIAEKKRSGKR